MLTLFLLIHTYMHTYTHAYVYTMCRRDIKNTDTNRFHASDHHHCFYYYCPFLSFSFNNDDTILFFALTQKKSIFLSSPYLHSFLYSSLTVHSPVLLPSSSSVLIYQQYTHTYTPNNIEKMLNCVYNLH